jgi:uncharacterized LabA/DUF88 family protein/cold shock CspA family protein
MADADSKLTRIGVFYDGNHFYHVSNYYHYNHPRRARISISGLHEFIRNEVAKAESTNVRNCQIVDAHYFRGRLRAQEAELRGALYRERIFDEVLMREGVVTHYLPLTQSAGRVIGEKGIDVWLALEAYELAIYKRFDVSVLVAGDGDFLPLVRKLNTLGTRVMLIAWDFKYIDQNGEPRETRTSQLLLDEVTYPMMMHQIIDDRSLRNDPVVNSLFVPASELKAVVAAASSTPISTEATAEGSDALGMENKHEGTIHNLQDGYGFITPNVSGENMFFFHSQVLNRDFSELKPGNAVEYEIGKNDRGPCAVRVTVVG